MNMFNWFKKKEKLTAHDVYLYATGTRDMCVGLQERLSLLEKHVGVEYFHGGKNKPHYRTKRTRITK